LFDSNRERAYVLFVSTELTGRHGDMTAQQAIEQSVRQDEIVHIEWSSEAEETLLAECDASVDAYGVTEYWGTTEDGHDWRVHVSAREAV
jgi:propanediol utilization protein